MLRYERSRSNESRADRTRLEKNRQDIEDDDWLLNPRRRQRAISIRDRDEEGERRKGREKEKKQVSSFLLAFAACSPSISAVFTFSR